MPWVKVAVKLDSPKVVFPFVNRTLRLQGLVRGMLSGIDTPSWLVFIMMKDSPDN